MRKWRYYDDNGDNRGNDDNDGDDDNGDHDDNGDNDDNVMIIWWW